MKFGSRIFTSKTALLAAVLFIIMPQTVLADDPSPTAYWKLDETTGTAVENSAGGSDGEVHGDANWVPGQFGNAFSFNGVDNYIATSYTFPAQNSGTSFTWAAWLYAEENNPINVVVLGWRQGDNWIKLTASGLEYGNGMLINHPIATGEWVHVVITKNGTNFKYYEAGKEVGGGGTSDKTTTSHQFYLGSDPGFDDGYFSGKLDDVRLYDVALTPEQVGAVYTEATGISNIASSTSLTTATVTWETSTESDSTVWYGTSSGTYTTSTSSATLTTDHSIGLTGLSEETTYYFVVVSKDGSGSTATSSEQTLTTLADLTPPTISNIATSSPTSSGVTISWTTNEAASTKVVYTVDGNYATSTIESDTSPRVTGHSATLSGLLPCTEYDYKVVSANAKGNYATSTSDSFITAGCVGEITPTFSVKNASFVEFGSGTGITDGDTSIDVTTPPDITTLSSIITIQVKSFPAGGVLSALGTPDASLESAVPVAFDVTALIDESTVLDSFDAPATIEFTYSDDDIAGLVESSINMYHYHGGSWVPLDDCTLDEDANTISCTTLSFSVFALFGIQEEPPVSSGSISGGYTRYGCRDPQASNYDYFVWHTPELCQYGAASPVLASGALCPRYNFTRWLRFGSEGEDVRALQRFLNCAGFKLAESGPGSPGNETIYFVGRTDAAVLAFQNTYMSEVLAPLGLTQATGIFAEYSRNKAESLMSP